jgi:hypothetical protein
MSAPIPRAPPLSIDCITCGTKMDLITVEPKDHRTLYTYRCPSRHLQELAMANLDVAGNPPRRAHPSFSWAWLGRALR